MIALCLECIDALEAEGSTARAEINARNDVLLANDLENPLLLRLRIDQAIRESTAEEVLQALETAI